MVDHTLLSDKYALEVKEVMQEAEETMGSIFSSMKPQIEKKCGELMKPTNKLSFWQLQQCILGVIKKD